MKGACFTVQHAPNTSMQTPDTCAHPHTCAHPPTHAHAVRTKDLLPVAGAQAVHHVRLVAELNNAHRVPA